MRTGSRVGIARFASLCDQRDDAHEGRLSRAILRDFKSTIEGC